MAHYTYEPTEFDGQSLTGGNLTCRFRQGRGPLTTRPFRPVEVQTPLRGPQDVRGQPTGTTWALFVTLGTTDETDLDALFEIFDEERGLQLLKVTDGAASPVTWRVKVRVLTIRRGISDRYFEVVLRVPDPVWEEDTETDATEVDTASTAKTWTQTNNGSRKVRGIYTLTPKGVRTEADLATLMSLRGFVVNRAQQYWNDEPLHLFDDAGADDTVDHAALVNDTGVASTTLSTTISIGQAMPFTITVASAAGFDPSGMIVIEHGTGDVEQFRYSSISSNDLVLEERAIGGTAAAAHASPDAVAQSRSMLNGDDIRVYVNGVEVDRWLDGTNTTTLRCWINATMPEVLELTLLADITAGDPADGGDLEFLEGVAGLPERGQVVIENEVITYRGRDIAGRKITTIERGAWGSTAAAHTASSVTAYRCDILFTVTTGFADATPAPAPAGRQPAIQKNSSTNTKWFWGDAADDADTVFYDKANPDRTAMWIPSVEQHEQDVAVALRMPDQKDAMQWEDDAPQEGMPLATRMTVSLPQGVDPSASAIKYDAQGRADIRLRLLGVDAESNEIELVDFNDIDDTALTGEAITPNAALHRLIANGVRGSVLGNDETGGSIASLTVASADYQLKIVLDQDTDLAGVHLRLKDNATGTYTYQVNILDDTGNSPADGNVLAAFDVWADDAGASGFGPDFDEATLGAAFKRIQYALASGSLRLVAGTYWIEVHMSAVASSGAITLEVGPPRTQHNIVGKDGAETGTKVGWCRVMHAHEFPIQIEADQLNGSVIADFDKVSAVLQGGRTPYVDRDGDFAIALYHIIGQLKNNTTGDTIDVDFWCPTTGSLQIDVEKRTVVFTDGNHVISVPGAIAPSNLEDWMPLASGSNSMQYLEPVANIDIRHQHRGRKL